jgi:cobalt-zinc-cadmium efflux system membrane fusion protein
MTKFKIAFIFNIFLILFLIGGCQSNDQHDHSQEEHQDEPMAEEHHDDEVGLTKEQIQKIGLELGTFENKNLQSTLKVSGKLELPPQNKASVSSIVAGKILNIHVKPGQYVNKGGALATIQNPDFIDWQQEYLEVKGELIYLDKELTRQEDLVNKEIAPQKQLEKVASERAIAHAKLQGLKSRMEVVGIPIPDQEIQELLTTAIVRSPISGFVRSIKMNTGTYSEPNQELFEIVDNHHLHIDFMVFEKDLAFIKNGQIIQFSLQSKPKEVMTAKIFAIGKALDEERRTISIHAEIIDDKDHLLPGMYVEGRIILEDQKVPALPEEAIAIDNGLYYIFVKEEEHEDEIHFRKIPVIKINSDFGYIQVESLEKLEDNAEIVVNGAYFLMAQSKKGEEGAGGHHH